MLKALQSIAVAAWAAALSRDRRWIVFTSERTGAANIYRVHPDGTGMQRLTRNAGFDDQAALSPDGSELAFVSTRAHGTTDIWVLNMRTQRLRDLTQGVGGNFRPSWSPDGRWLAFSSDRGPPPRSRGGGRFEEVQELGVYIIRADGRGLRRLTDAVGHDAHCSWSPDGKHLLFASARFGFKDESALYYDWSIQPYTELFVMYADGSHQRPLTDNKWEDGTAAWLP